MMWKYLWAAGWKVIFMSPAVAERVAAHVKADTEGVIDEGEAEKAFVDLPGMIMSTRQYWKGEIDGLSIEIPASDVSHYIREMRGHVDLPKFVNRGWWNVYGYRQCISLSRDQYVALLKELEAAEEWARGVAEEEAKRLTAAIEKMNADLAAAGKGVQFVAPRAGVVPKKPFGRSWN